MFPILQLFAQALFMSNPRHVSIRHALCLGKGSPAGDAWRSTDITSGHPSLAGQLLQGESWLVFGGASLLAKRSNERSTPQANIRWQASSHKEKAILHL
jgi:hypothetical protein